MKNVTLIPTCEKEIFFIPEMGKMYIRIIEKNQTRYKPLVEFLEGKK